MQHEALPIPGLWLGRSRAEDGLPLPQGPDVEGAVHIQFHPRRIHPRAEHVRPD